MKIAIVRGPHRIIIEMSSTNKTQPNYKYVSCFASIICFSLLQSFSLSLCLSFALLHLLFSFLHFARKLKSCDPLFELPLKLAT